MVKLSPWFIGRAYTCKTHRYMGVTNPLVPHFISAAPAGSYPSSQENVTSVSTGTTVPPSGTEFMCGGVAGYCASRWSRQLKQVLIFV